LVPSLDSKQQRRRNVHEGKTRLALEIVGEEQDEHEGRYYAATE
jgi:hypothetical protein